MSRHLFANFTLHRLLSPPPFGSPWRGERESLPLSAGRIDSLVHLRLVTHEPCGHILGFTPLQSAIPTTSASLHPRLALPPPSFPCTALPPLREYSSRCGGRTSSFGFWISCATRRCDGWRGRGERFLSVRARATAQCASACRCVFFSPPRERIIARRHKEKRKKGVIPKDRIYLAKFDFITFTTYTHTHTHRRGREDRGFVHRQRSALSSCPCGYTGILQSVPAAAAAAKKRSV